MTENASNVLAEAADSPALMRAEEIRLRYAAIVESSDDAIVTTAQQAGAARRPLRESAERCLLMGNTAPVMIWMSGTDHEVTYLNQTWVDFAGRPPDPAVEEVRAFERREPFQLEHRLRRHDGEYRWVVTAGVPRYNAEGAFVGYVGTHVDITERKLAEAALASQKLIEAREEEKTRMARELHDDISQRIALLGMHLTILKRGLAASAIDLAQTVGEIDRQIGDIASDVQALSRGLHPPRLELMGLKAAVAGFCEELSNRYGVMIDAHFENIPKALPPDISLCLYRVLQEALQNVVKHSGSQRAHVSLGGQINTVKLTVTDSGHGFDPHEAMSGPGIGLTSMKERLKVVGGQISIHARRGHGTTIHAVAPLCLPTKSTNGVE